MTPEKFKERVKEMREAQKNYFKSRDSFWLARAKSLEKEVDTELQKPSNPTLFNN